MFSENHDVAVEKFKKFHTEFSQEVCMDIVEDDKSDADHEAQIHEFLQTRGIALVDISKPECLDVRKELIIWLKENTTMSGRKLAEVTGINRETIREKYLHIYSLLLLRLLRYRGGANTPRHFVPPLSRREFFRIEQHEFISFENFKEMKSIWRIEGGFRNRLDAVILLY